MATKKRHRKSTQPKASRPHMPGYGLAEGKKGLLPWHWAKQRLEKSHNYWISTTRPDGSPHTMVVWGIWMTGAFYFSTGRQSRKARNLAGNPRCVVCTERADEAVIVEGIAHEVGEPVLRRKFMTAYESKYNWDMSAYQQEPVLAVIPRFAFGLFEREFLNAATRWRFEN
jgi:nitroimidazol reductase NimA-like FMN-containing flavoprotein (pyridoxamine 5'-phosphate oxidase superfamily)